MFYNKKGVFLTKEEFLPLKDKYIVKNLQKLQDKLMNKWNWYKAPDKLVHFSAEKKKKLIKIPSWLRSFWWEKFEDCMYWNIKYCIHPKLINEYEWNELDKKQDIAIEELMKANVGLLHASTWVGKTAVCAKIISKLNTKTLIIVQGITLMNQMKSDLEEFFWVKCRTLSGSKKKQKWVYENIIVWNIDTVIKQSPDFFAEFDLVILDECITEDTLIQCESWYKLIQDINIWDKVWTINENSNILELKKVLKTIKKKRQRTLTKIWNLICTDNHKIYTNKWWIESQSVTNNFKTLEDFNWKINVDSVLLGCLLWDAYISFSKWSITFWHTYKNKDYLEWKHKILAKKYNVKPIYYQKNLWYSNNYMCKFSINKKEFTKKIQKYILDKNWKRIISDLILNQIWDDWLAVLIQDDWACIKNRISIYTHRYWNIWTQIMLRWINEKYWIEWIIKNDTRLDKEISSFISFNSRDSYIIYTRIFPYIIPSMAKKFKGINDFFCWIYKNCILCWEKITHIWEVAQNHKNKLKYCNREMCVKAKSLCSNIFYKKKWLLNTKDMYNYLIKKYWKQENKYEYVYDLSVEDNHNYFADGILVHNCDTFLQAPRRLAFIWTLSPKYLYSMTGTIELNHVDNSVFNLYVGKKTKLLEKHFTPTINKVLTGFTYILDDIWDFHELKEDLYNDENRNNLIVEMVWTTLGTRKWIMFCSYVEHAKTMQKKLEAKGIKTFLLIWEIKKDEREQIKSEIKAWDWPCILIGSVKIIGRGLNIPELSIWYLTVAEKFNSNIEQYVGRIIRKHPWKTDAIWYDFIDNWCKLLYSQSTLRARTYRKQYPWCLINLI